MKQCKQKKASSRWFADWGWVLILGLAVHSLGAQSTLKISDENGDPLVGATVIRLPDAGLGVTDVNGQLEIAPLAAGDSLMVVYLGFFPGKFSGRELSVSDYRVSLTPRNIMLSSMTVIGRRNELARNLPYQIETVDGAARTQVQSLSTADALASLSGVYVQKSQLGAGSPIVRGFEANRVLLVVDGVRMNNAIFRNGHLQNAITVDPNALERIELIYGSGALAYGSDAIGGVVHFRTVQPEFRGGNQPALSGYQEANFSTAAAAVNYAGQLGYGGKRWAGLTHYSFTRFGDLRAGGNRPAEYPGFGLRRQYVCGTCDPDQIFDNENPNVQIGSGYRQYNLLQKFRFALADQLELDANFQFSTTSDIPRYDALIERRDGQFRWARWDYGPQTRALASLNLDDRRETSLYDLATYLVSYQFIEEDRIQRRFQDPVTEESLVDVGALNFQIDFAKNLASGTDLRYGLDLRHDAVSATAFPSSVATRYPSQGSSLGAAGIYLDLSHDFSDFWQLRGGLRYGYQRLAATFGEDDPVEWPAAYLEGIVSNSSAVTATAGVRYRRGIHDLRLLFAQGFRAPNVDDFAKFREQSGRIQVPSPELTPERSNTFEAGYILSEDGWRAEATAYVTLLSDAIIRRDGTLPDGRNFFVSRGDTLLVDINVNAESARVYGFDLAASKKMGSDWTAAAAFHWLRGLRKQLAPDGETLDLPQDHIPPAYGRAGLSYAHGKWEGSLRIDFQVTKEYEDYAVNEISGTRASGYTFDRIGTADNPELTPFLPTENRFAGSYGWWMLNVYGAYNFSESCSVRLKGENLLDRHYRPFASGISAAGIDLGLGVRVVF